MIASPQPESARTPLDGRTFAIGVLSVTACILFVGFVLVTLAPREAQAIGQTDRSGDYLIATQRISNSNEGLAVIDAAAKKLILYGFDFNRKSLKILTPVAFDRLPQPRDRGNNKR